MLQTSAVFLGLVHAIGIFICVDVQKADAGNLTCEVIEKIKEGDNWVRDELVAIKSVPIQVRGMEV